jgi:phosphoribosylpyrophosphate synthetase
MTDTVEVVDEDWPRLRVVSVAPLIAGALERFLADASIGDLDR